MTNLITNTRRIRKLEAAGVSDLEISRVLEEQPTFFHGTRIFMNVLGFYHPGPTDRDIWATSINELEAKMGLAAPRPWFVR